MDLDLVARAQKGDQRAFETLTRTNHPRLYRVALGILRDPHLAEDATQQAHIDIWRHLRRLRDVSKFEGWSYRILVNACYGEAKRKPKWVPDSEMQPAHEPRAGDAFSAVIDRDVLERGFEHLSVDHRAVIVLRYLLDLPPEQVAEALDIPLGTVGSRLSRAMESLRAVLEADARSAVTAIAQQGTVR
jgi:RNA polymerase sigma-70 factor (ECF subfamily)